MTAAMWPCGVCRSNEDSLGTLLHASDDATLRDGLAAYIAAQPGNERIAATLAAVTRHVQHCCGDCGGVATPSAAALTHARALAHVMDSLPALLHNAGVAYEVWQLFSALGDFFLDVHRRSYTCSDRTVDDAQAAYVALLTRSPLLSCATLTRSQYAHGLHVVTQLLHCTAHTHHTTVEDTALRCGELLYRRRALAVRDDAYATSDTAAAGVADVAAARATSATLPTDAQLYLRARAVALQRRHGRLLEAAQAYADCYALTRAHDELQAAAVCALLSVDATAGSSGSASSGSSASSSRQGVTGGASSVATATPAQRSPRALLLQRLLHLSQASTLDAALRALLHKAAHMHILRAADVATLATYAVAVTDDSSALRSAVVAHNLHAIAAVYDNVGFARLTRLLLPPAVAGVTLTSSTTTTTTTTNNAAALPSWTERDAIDAVARAVTTCARGGGGGVAARIDDVARRVYFPAATSEAVLRAYDNTVRDVCGHLTTAVNMVIRQQPDDNVTA